jgi:hypothetical protein
MHEHQGVPISRGDDLGGDNRLAEPRRGGEHADVVAEHGAGGRILLRGKLAAVADIQRMSLVLEIPDLDLDAEVLQQFERVVEAASRQRDVPVEEIGA